MPTLLLIDNRSTPDLVSCLDTRWRVVSDTVMGDVSPGRLTVDAVEGRPCLCLQGEVSLSNNGGFVQASLDLALDGVLDAGAFDGFELDVFGNGESYNLHVRTADTRIVWQSVAALARCSLYSLSSISTLRPLSPALRPLQGRGDFIFLDVRCLRRIGIVAIGRAFSGRVGLYG